MSTLIKNYPVFEDNQVLTSSQLNQMHNYLDQQTRLTRVSLIGIGVVCGMDIICNDDQDELTITKGVGVTSEGYLITIGECVTTQYRTYSKPNTVSYPPFEDPLTQLQDVELHELLTAEADIDPEEEEDVTDLNAEFLSDKIVLLFLECYDKDLKSCLGKSCDELGIDRILTLRKLVITEEEYNNKVKERLNGGMLDEAYPDKYELPVLQVRRPLLKPATPATLFYIGMASEYLKAVDEVWDPLYDAMIKSYSVYSPVLEDLYNEQNPFEMEAITNTREQLEEYRDAYSSFSESIYGVQYFYDFVKDLILAYEEFRMTAMELSGACCPDMTRFPKHLLLGLACEQAGGLCAEVEYRNEFVASPAFSDQRYMAEKVQMLHKRLVLLWESFDLGRLKDTSEREIKITPSCEKKSTLSERAIPYYYDSKRESSIEGLGTLEENWNFDLQRQCRSSEYPQQISYDNHETATDDFHPIKTPLFYDLDSYNFLRIEGHISKQVRQVEARLHILKSEHNLSFDIKKVYFGDLMEENPMPACLIEDLQPQYSIWRNKILLFLKNIVQASKTTERAVLNRAMFMSAEEAGFRTSGASFSRRSAFNVNTTDFTNVFMGADPTRFTESANRLYTTLNNFERASSRENVSLSASFESNTDTSIRELFASFNTCIHQLIDAMPLDFADFEMSTWLNHYKCVLRVIVKIMKWMASMATNAQYRVMMTIYLYFAWIIHRIVNFLAIYPYITIRVLNDTLQERQEALVEAMQLSRFRGNHPGVEHKAGVAPGQTFLLVYQLPHQFDELRDEDGNEFAERFASFGGFNIDFENMDFNMDEYLEVVSEMEGRVVADFTLPFTCCDPCEDIYSEVVTLDPFAPPVTAIAMTDDALEISSYKSVEIQLINDLYDPDIYKASLTSQPNFGSTIFRDDPYEPDNTKTKQMLVYDVDPQKLAAEIQRTDDFFIIDEFNYQIQDVNRQETVGSDTITIFIPVQRQTKPQVGTVTGTVTTVGVEGNQEPLQGVNIVVEGTDRGTTTNSDGNYTLSNVPIGQQTLIAKFVGYVDARKTVDITTGTNSIDFVMSPAKDIIINFERIVKTLEIQEQEEEVRKIRKYYSTSMNNAKAKADQLVQLEGKEEVTAITKAANAVKEFSDEEDISVVRLNNEYNNVRNELVEQIQNTKGAEKELHKEALNNVTVAYLDRLAYTQPDDLTSTTKDVLNESANIFNASEDIDMKTTMEAWEKKSKGYVSQDFQSNVKSNLRLK
ncbi:carboxypeptidase-like regulatory domain-containing protein [Aliifodinibius sp. S!AR15-10]|uniref:carboxypeptidase-like regulatory domain-containing protein n=1 Tax=Aliifodinibius sp. S!AR15-10 TaxID=2950437 RepID=UPI00285C1D8A|nr:carboxypeptidase-like regulatory domain-containing protein [Aliifodinibius sp. S!AR15-10]MDR8390609.1 carboxypeptidase-like regulatory domain-containing protein [Aliifodinibius sp. S!AR15-10]